MGAGEEADLKLLEGRNNSYTFCFLISISNDHSEFFVVVVVC